MMRNDIIYNSSIVHHISSSTKSLTSSSRAIALFKKEQDPFDLYIDDHKGEER